MIEYSQAKGEDFTLEAEYRQTMTHYSQTLTYYSQTTSEYTQAYQKSDQAQQEYTQTTVKHKKGACFHTRFGMPESLLMA